MQDQSHDQSQQGADEAARSRTRYQVGTAHQARQIEVLLNYPKVGPLGAGAIAINLGTDRRHMAPVLEQLMREGSIEQVEHDRYIGEGIRRAARDS